MALTLLSAPSCRVADLAAVAVGNTQSMRPLRVLATTLSFVLHRVNTILAWRHHVAQQQQQNSLCDVLCRTRMHRNKQVTKQCAQCNASGLCAMPHSSTNNRGLTQHR